MNATAGPKVLFIDDDAALARLIAKDFKRRGCLLEHAADSEQGLKRLAEGGVDAVVLDHYLPDGDGLEALASIQRLADPPPVIYLTGAQDSRLAVAALKAGAADYIVKDVQGEFIPLLDAVISAALQSAELRRVKEAAETEVRLARDQYKALAEERALLMSEVNHRVSNSLQLIASMLHLQMQAAKNAEIRAALLDANKRVLAVAQVHYRLYSSGNVTSVALNEYLAALTKDLANTAGRDAANVRLSLEADTVETRADRAVAIGIVVTELILNALKHAYPDGRGVVRVQLRSVDGSHAELSVEDDGIGFANGPSNGPPGVGNSIVRAMAQKLGGDITYDLSHKGARAVLTFRPA